MQLPTCENRMDSTDRFPKRHTQYKQSTHDKYTLVADAWRRSCTKGVQKKRAIFKDFAKWHLINETRARQFDFSRIHMANPHMDHTAVCPIFAHMLF